VLITDCILQRTKDIIILMSSAPEKTMEEVAFKAASLGDTPLKEEEEVIDSEESETTTMDAPLKEEEALSTEDSKDHEDEDDDDEIVSLRKQAFIFHHMAIHPWFYMLFWPVLFSFLIGFGWTQDDIIEDEVTNIWIPTSGSYHNDVSYAASLGEDDLPTSSFAAMSIARDGGNLFTESRLNEIAARMEKAEQTTVRKQGGRGTSCLLLDPQSHSLSASYNRSNTRAPRTVGKTFARAMEAFRTNSPVLACLRWICFKSRDGTSTTRDPNRPLYPSPILLPSKIFTDAPGTRS
jgi:hypothetical protein